MKTRKFLKPLFILFIAVAFLSCSNDDDDGNDTEQNIDLIGTWLRSDVTDQFEFVLVFDNNGLGSRIVSESNDEGQGTSSSTPFGWNTENGNITLEFDNDVIITDFILNPNENELILGDTPDLTYSKIE